MSECVFWFIDDERDPPDDGSKYVVLRSFQEMKDRVCEHGFPDYISFDHDLGDGGTGMDCAKWLIEVDLQQRDWNPIKFPETFWWTVHSENPVGRDNINGLLESYFKFKERMRDE